MLTAVLDKSLLVAVIGVALAAALAWNSASSRRRWPLLAAAALLLISTAIGLAGLIHRSPRDLAIERLRQMADAAEREDADGVLEGISDRFRSGMMDRDGFESGLRPVMRRVKLESVTLRGIDAEVDADRVVVSFVINAKGTYAGFDAVSGYRMRVKTTFEEDPDGEWRVTEATRLDLVDTTQEMPLLEVQ